jgi:hypothetical protein
MGSLGPTSHEDLYPVLHYAVKVYLMPRGQSRYNKLCILIWKAI